MSKLHPPTPESPLTALRSLRSMPQHLTALVPVLSNVILAAEPKGGGASVARILEHLLGAERLLNRGVKAFTGVSPSDAPPLGAPGEHGREGISSKDEADALVPAYRSSRRETVELLGALPLREWERRVRHRERGEVGFHEYVAYLAAHERSHLAEIEGILRSGESALGPAPFLAHLELPFIRERIEAARDSPLRLTSNENRLGLPESVRCAIVEAFADANLYPDDSAVDLTRALADRHDVGPEGIVHAHGSTDLLRIVAAAHAVGRPKVRLVIADPTFEQLVGYAEPYGVELSRVPLLAGSWAHDLAGMRRAAESGPEISLNYICNPNNPTGTLTPVGELERWIEDAPPDHLFVVDEAYFEFVDDPSYESLDRLAWERPNVVILRTFSKVYGMAGVRVGYAVAHPQTADRLKQFKSGRGPNHLGNMAALAALQDDSILRRAREANLQTRRMVYEVLAELGLPHMKSHTNFVMHEVGGDVGPYVERMEKAGFAVGRPFPAFPSHNRVSLGTADEMRRWADALREFRQRGWV